MMNRELSKYRKLLARVRDWQKKLHDLPDEEIAAMTDRFRERRRKGESLDHILPEAFAAICEADRRVLHKDPYDVQILGGIALHKGCLAEIGTGEGKTLTATMPMYLNAIDGKGAILVTNNDYLAIRDYTEMGPVYRFMGLTVGLVIHGVMGQAKKDAYAATSPTAPTTSSALTTSGTTWPSTPASWCSGATTSPWWTRWTPSLSTRPAPP